MYRVVTHSGRNADGSRTGVLKVVLFEGGLVECAQLLRSGVLCSYLLHESLDEIKIPDNNGRANDSRLGPALPERLAIARTLFGKTCGRGSFQSKAEMFEGGRRTASTCRCPE